MTFVVKQLIIKIIRIITIDDLSKRKTIFVINFHYSIIIIRYIFFRMEIKIDENVFEKMLRKKLPNEIVQILEIKRHCMSEKGLNFLSDLYIMRVRYMVISNNKKNETKSECSINFIIKTEPPNGLSCEIARQQNVFQIELKVLQDILPRIKGFISHQIGPNLLYSSDNPPFFIMENLKDRGFIMKDRQKGLSREHCSLVIKQIARLHAGSVAIFEKVGKIILKN